MIQSYSFSTSFKKTNSSWLIFKSTKALEILLSNFAFYNNAILLSLSFFFLIIDLYFLIAAVIAPVLNPKNWVITIPIRIATKEAKSEIKIHPVTAEAKLRVL